MNEAQQEAVDGLKGIVRRAAENIGALCDEDYEDLKAFEEEANDAYLAAERAGL